MIWQKIWNSCFRIILISWTRRYLRESFGLAWCFDSISRCRESITQRLVFDQATRLTRWNIPNLLLLIFCDLLSSVGREFRELYGYFGYFCVRKCFVGGIRESQDPLFFWQMHHDVLSQFVWSFTLRLSTSDKWWEKTCQNIFSLVEKRKKVDRARLMCLFTHPFCLRVPI